MFLTQLSLWGPQTCPRVTSCPALPATVLVLALKISCSRKPLWSGHLVILQIVYTTSKPELSWTPEIYPVASRISLNPRFPQLPQTQDELKLNLYIPYKIFSWTSLLCHFPLLMVKNLPAMWETWVCAGDLGSVPGLGRSPGGGHGKLLPNILAWRVPMDRGAWRATIHGVTKSQTWLSK